MHDEHDESRLHQENCTRKTRRTKFYSIFAINFVTHSCLFIFHSILFYSFFRSTTLHETLAFCNRFIVCCVRVCVLALEWVDWLDRTDYFESKSLFQRSTGKFSTIGRSHWIIDQENWFGFIEIDWTIRKKKNWKKKSKVNKRKRKKNWKRFAIKAIRFSLHVSFWSHTNWCICSFT